MKLLIAGSRGITSLDLSECIPEDTEMIICGGAKGIDTIANEYAINNNIPITIVRPQYDLYGIAAPIKRNEHLVDMADEVLVVWDGASRGTKSTIEYARRMNKKVTVIIVDKN